MRSKLTIIDSIVNTYSLRSLEKQKVIKEIQYKSMDEYAKEISIEFFKWHYKKVTEDPISFLEIPLEKRYNLLIKSITDENT